MKIFILALILFVVGCGSTQTTTCQVVKNEESVEMSGKLRCIIRIWNTGALVDIRDEYPKARSRSWNISFGVLVSENNFTELTMEESLRQTAIDLCGKKVKATGIMTNGKLKTSKLELYENK